MLLRLPRSFLPVVLVSVAALAINSPAEGAVWAKSSFAFPQVSIGPIKGPGPKGCVSGRTKIHVRVANVFSPTRIKTSVGTRVFLDNSYFQPRAPSSWIWTKWSGRAGRLLKFDLFVDATRWRKGPHKLTVGAVDIAEIDFESFASLTVVRCAR